MKPSGIRGITFAALIAALYAALTMALWQFSSLMIQVRLSEALCILPFFTPAAIPGLTIGCLLSNLLAGNPWDALFGTLATLLGAVSTYFIGRKWGHRSRWLLPLPAVLWNTLIIPFVLYYAYGYQSVLQFTDAWIVLLLYALSIFIGQTIACYGVGMPLYFTTRRLDRSSHLFTTR